MLEFANLAFLLLLPAVPLLFVWWLRRKRLALRYPDTRIFAGLPSGNAPRVRWIGSILRSLAILSLIVALAGPRLPDLKTRIPAEGVAITIVMDASGSMEQETFVWNAGSPNISRREAANRAFHLFVAGGDAPDGTHFEGRSSERGTDAIGLVVFTDWPQTLCPPTLNHSVLLHILDDYRRPRDDGSNHGDAIAEGLIRLEKATLKRKVLILLSDGEYWYPDLADPERKPLKPRQAAQLAANLGIPIYVIDTGGEVAADAKPGEIQQREDGRAINRAIAELSGGRVFNANNGRELLNVCKTIDGLERQPILSHAYRRYRDLYPWFAGLAFGCILIIVMLEQTRWNRLP